MMGKFTRHGEQRLRKRGGLKRKATKRHVELVFAEGLRPESFRGPIRGYLDAIAIGHASTPIIYGQTVYVFGEDRLVTMFPLAAKYRRYLKPSGSRSNRRSGESEAWPSGRSG